MTISSGDSLMAHIQFKWISGFAYQWIHQWYPHFMFIEDLDSRYIRDHLRDWDWRAADQFEQNNPQKETISELEQISKLSLYQSKGKSSIWFLSGSIGPSVWPFWGQTGLITNWRTEDWSTDIPKLRKAAISKPEKIGIDFIFQNLTNIR